MARSPQTKEKQAVESVQELMTSLQALGKKSRVCLRCGAVMQYLDTKFWLYGSDSSWDLRLPVCACEMKARATIRLLIERRAVPPVDKSWRHLFQAALAEMDKSKLSKRIADAEMALVLRARELLHTGDEDLRERRAVDGAILTLHVLRGTTFGYGSDGSQPCQDGTPAA